MEVTDGSTFTAFFGDASAGQGGWNPYFILTTKEMADMFKKAVKEEMNLDVMAAETAIWEWWSKGSFLGTNYGEKFGIKDAIGQAAKMFGWTPIPAESFFDNLPKTSLICNSTLRRIGQGVS
jgi:hypothetical protein